MVTFHSRFVVLLLAAVLASRCSKTANAEEPINLAAINDRLSAIHNGIESLRVEMGKPKCREFKLVVTNASSRDVYYQALALNSLADRLFVEINGDIQSFETMNPSRNINIIDVWQVVDTVALSLQKVRLHLGVTNDVTLRRHTDATLDDLFLRLNQECRQLNILLDHQFAPADVYQQLTTAIAYAALLRANFPGHHIPDPPEYERGKTPSDVYVKLLECYGEVLEIAETAGTKILRISVANENPSGIKPGDVYGLASLLVSEISRLHNQRGTATEVRKTYYPGRKFPSHVYQRASLLNVQLNELKDLMRKNPAALEVSVR